ncbi:MAG: hypothetical protein LBT86_06400 [Deltaproteobacteria bacterium]|jgi:cell fate regulator YaaT (PSP1 superfamily)|nr:hypothetical protein [Deltaproteobacteria bacterium]
MGEKAWESDHSTSSPPSRGRDPQNRRGHKIKWDDEIQQPRTLPCQKTVHVRVRFGGQVQAFEIGQLELDIGDWVVVKQGDSLRLGLVTSKPIIWPANQGQKQILLPEDRRILRVATSEDLTRQAENQLRERDDYAYCQSCVNHLSLSLKLVGVEITLDNFKTIFYYTSEDRVDFRQLVRELVSRFRTRIEMRQIGVRLEALKLGGLGMCGRCFCCSSFLNNFCQVSVKMAKEQNLSLNTSKISGVCGRLMCCLSFENYAKNIKSSSQSSPKRTSQTALEESKMVDGQASDAMEFKDCRENSHEENFTLLEALDDPRDDPLDAPSDDARDDARDETLDEDEPLEWPR